MPTEFQMPKLGLTMEEGTIVEWLVDDGAEISNGQPVLVIETDKTETEVEAAATGVLQRTGQPGETFACGESIGRVYAPGEDIDASDPAAATPAPEAPAPAASSAPTAPAPAAAAAPAPAAATASGGDGRIIASPNARRVAAERGVELSTVAGTGPGGRITSEDVVDVAEGRVAPAAAAPAAAAPAPAPAAPAPTPPPTPSAAGSATPASVAARQLADLLGVDLSTVPADPTEGRVTRDGLAAHVRGLLAGASTGASSNAAAAAMQEPTDTIRMSGMRGTIAKRMHASLQEMAQLTLTMDADMDAVVRDRAARKDAGNAPGFTDYVIAAAARALRDHPRVNSQVTDAGIALLPDIHVGLAVALDEGLIVPVVENADTLSLGQLGPETTRLAEAARAGTLTPDEVQGGTFSVTALGMFGVDAFTPVINPPNTAILGVGRLRDDVIVVDGAVRTTTRVTLSLTWDHRVFDGAPAAEFTKTICDYLADPTRLV